MIKQIIKAQLEFKEQFKLFRFQNLKNTISLCKRILQLPGAAGLKSAIIQGMDEAVREYVDYTFEDKLTEDVLVFMDSNGAHDFFVENSDGYKKKYIRIKCSECSSNDLKKQYNYMLRYYYLCEMALDERAEEMVDEVIENWRKKVDAKKQPKNS